MACDETKMISKTKEYWKFKSEPRSKLTWYLKNLLPGEIECARKNNRWSTSKTWDNRVLVLMLGYSPEPLLQSIAYYQPSKVLMVLNENMGEKCSGIEYYENNFEFAFDLLVDNEFLNSKPEVLPAENQTTRANPIAVFRHLQKHLLPLMNIKGPGKSSEIIVDITGAKKSMVAGAYLFAAFVGAKISYVDFDIYDTDRGRPYGFSCKITEQENPIQAFRILDWTKAREFYEHNTFLSAKTLLENMRSDMSNWFSASPEIDERAKEIEAIDLFGEVLNMYELWSNGDYCGAKRKYDDEIKGKLKAPLRLPGAVEELGAEGYWPEGNKASVLISRIQELELGTHAHPSLYLDEKRLRNYTRDELAKIDKLIKFKEDNRSALLRGVGLTEVLLRARMLVLLNTRQFQFVVSPEDKEKSDESEWQEPDDALMAQYESVLFKRIVLLPSVQDFMQALRYCNDGHYRYKHTKLWPLKDRKLQDDKGAIWFRRTDAHDVPRLADNAILRHQENELRNKAIHTYLSIPKSIATETLKIAKQSADDFEEHWSVLLAENKTDLASRTKIEVLTDQADWSQVCEACGIDFLPL